MAVIVLDSELQKELIRERRRLGLDRYDEVWDGIYVMAPLPNDEHQEIAGDLLTALNLAVGWPRLGVVRPGINLSDRETGWKKNYRCPDAVVFLNGTTARNLKTHWVGGPDFAVEVVSPRDRTRAKLAFYAKLGTRELLVIDRDPWKLELYRLQADKLSLAGSSSLEQPELLISQVVPLRFRLVPGEARAQIEIAHADGVQNWVL